RIEAAVRDRACRLLKIGVERPPPHGRAEDPGPASIEHRLDEIGPRQVFAARWQQRCGDAEMPEAVRKAFERILQQAEGGEDEGNGEGDEGLDRAIDAEIVA